MSPWFLMGSRQVLVPCPLSKIMRMSVSSCSVTSAAKAAVRRMARLISSLRSTGSSESSVKMTPENCVPSVALTVSEGQMSKCG